MSTPREGKKTNGAMTQDHTSPLSSVFQQRCDNNSALNEQEALATMEPSDNLSVFESDEAKIVTTTCQVGDEVTVKSNLLDDKEILKIGSPGGDDTTPLPEFTLTTVFEDKNNSEYITNSSNASQQHCSTSKNESKDSLFDQMSKLHVAAVTRGEKEQRLVTTLRQFLLEHGQDPAEFFELLQAEERRLKYPTLLGVFYEYGVAGNTIDLKAAFRAYETTVVSNDLFGQVSLGNCWFDGKGTHRDERRAFELYLSAAKRGCPRGACNAGYCYDKGEGVHRSEDLALYYFEQSASLGNTVGQYNLGLTYENSIKFKDPAKAFKCYKMSAEGGNTTGAYHLARSYHNGIGTEVDLELAFHWYSKSAEDTPYGQCSLGFMHENALGTEKDDEKAFYWYEKAAEGGDIAAQYNLANFYLNGITPLKEKNHDRAFHWYSKSAIGCDSDGQRMLGACLECGFGCAVNPSKAFHWYRASVLNNPLDSYGQYSLGRCFARGFGTFKDLHAALDCFRKGIVDGEKNEQIRVEVHRLFLNDRHIE